MSPPLLTRRRLLAGTAAVAGGGLLLSLYAEDAEDLPLANLAGTLEPDAYLQITPDGRILLQVDKVEMGQGVMTGFVTLLAEELAVRPDQITPLHAPVHALFQDPGQVTGESKSMRTRWQRIRQTGATAREMLRAAAAERWQITADAVETIGDGRLRNARSGESLSYADLAAAAATQRRLADPPLHTAEQYRWIGTRVPRPDIADKVAGRTVYGIDVRLPGMLTAVVVRPPRSGDRLAGYDAGAALAAPGVRAVFEIPAGIAVLADSYWYAHQASRLLEVRWNDGPLAGVNMATVRAEQQALLDSDRLIAPRDDGDVDAALAAAGEVFSAEYFAPFLAHATMETMNATVRLQPGQCEIWAPTQAPDVVREVACRLTGLRREQVNVHTTFIGGGFGRRAMTDFIAEAVAVAIQSDAPVQLVWSREDDIRHDYLRSATTHRLRAALTDDGRLAAWHHHLLAPILTHHIMHTGLATILPEWAAGKPSDLAADALIAVQRRLVGPWQAGDGSRTMPYQASNVRVELTYWEPEIRVGIWRSVANSYNGFVVESFIDELAHRAGIDPGEFRRRHLDDQPRHRAVLERVLALADWGRPSAGRHQGLALHASFGSVVGQVAEVTVSPAGEIRVHKVSCVIDCGTAINPDIVRQQMEGCIIFGLTAALFGEISFEDGRVAQSNFHDYRMLRLAESPVIEVEIMPSSEPPSGVGEAGVPPIAAAVANAVFAATGQRLRELPLRPAPLAQNAARL